MRNNPKSSRVNSPSISLRKFAHGLLLARKFQAWTPYANFCNETLEGVMLASNRTAPFASFLRRLPRAGLLCASAVLFNTVVADPLAAQDQPPPVQDIVAVAAQDALTKTMADRVRQAWAAWKKGDACWERPSRVPRTWR